VYTVVIPHLTNLGAQLKNPGATDIYITRATSDYRFIIGHLLRLSPVSDTVISSGDDATVESKKKERKI